MFSFSVISWLSVPPKLLERLGRGASFEQKKDWKEAEAEYRPALALDPGSASLHFDLGYVLARQGKLDDAIAEFRNATKIYPEMEDMRENLVRALHEKEAGAATENTALKD